MGDRLGNADRLELSGKSWSGWKFSHRACEMFGELRVTRYKSGGVAGRENEGLNGVAGLVWGRELVPPMKVSAPVWRTVGDAADER